MMKNGILLLIIFVFGFFSSIAQVAINTDGSAADNSAMLDIKSNNKGLLIPRMTFADTANIISPALGLIIFVTDDSSFYYHKNSGWVKMTAGETGWTVNGNVVYNTIANVGIGTSSSKAKLSVYGSGNDTILLYLHGNQNNPVNQYGNVIEITKDESGNQFGTYHKLTNTYTGNEYPYLYGIYNEIDGAGKPVIYSTYNYIKNSGENSHFGIYNILTGGGTGAQYGAYQKVDVSGDGKHYGSYSELNGLGSGSKYGFCTYIDQNAGGKHYGVYSNVPGSANYAGYFLGNIFISNKLGVGTGSPNEQVEIADFGNNARMILSDGYGANRRVLLFISPSDANDFSGIESYKYGSGAQGKELQFNTIGHGQLTMGSHVIPFNDNSYDLGEATRSWRGVYYYNLFAHSFAAFPDENISAEILAHPVKTQAGANNLDVKSQGRIDPASLPENLTDGTLILTNNVVSFNYQANYKQQVQISALQKQINEQQQTIEQLKKQLSEMELLIKRLNELMQK